MSRSVSAFLAGTQYIDVNEGDDVTIECPGVRHEQYIMEWKKDGRRTIYFEQMRNDVNYPPKIHSKFEGRLQYEKNWNKYTLKLSNIKKSDQGSYKCIYMDFFIDHDLVTRQHISVNWCEVILCNKNVRWFEGLGP